MKKQHISTMLKRKKMKVRADNMKQNEKIDQVKSFF